MTKIKFNTPIIEIPNEFNVIDKNGSIKTIKPLTKNGNIVKRNNKKAINIKTNDNIDEIKIINPGEKINNNDKPIKKVVRRKKINNDNNNSLLNDLQILQKKPKIKVSNPIITNHKKDKIKNNVDINYNKKKIKKDTIKQIDDININPIEIKHVIKPKKANIQEILNKVDYYYEPSLTKEQNEKLQKDLIKFKKYIIPYKLQEFLINHNLEPSKSTMIEWEKFKDNFLKNHNLIYGFNDDDVKPIKENKKIEEIKLDEEIKPFNIISQYFNKIEDKKPIEEIKNTKKATIKVSDPIITDHKKDETLKENEPYEGYNKDKKDSYERKLKDYLDNHWKIKKLQNNLIHKRYDKAHFLTDEEKKYYKNNYDYYTTKIGHRGDSGYFNKELAWNNKEYSVPKYIKENFGYDAKKGITFTIFDDKKNSKIYDKLRNDFVDTFDNYNKIEKKYLDIVDDKLKGGPGYFLIKTRNELKKEYDNLIKIHNEFNKFIDDNKNEKYLDELKKTDEYFNTIYNYNPDKFKYNNIDDHKFKKEKKPNKETKKVAKNKNTNNDNNIDINYNKKKIKKDTIKQIDDININPIEIKHATKPKIAKISNIDNSDIKYNKKKIKKEVIIKDIIKEIDENSLFKKKIREKDILFGKKTKDKFKIKPIEIKHATKPKIAKISSIPIKKIKPVKEKKPIKETKKVAKNKNKKKNNDNDNDKDKDKVIDKDKDIVNDNDKDKDKGNNKDNDDDELNSVNNALKNIKLRLQERIKNKDSYVPSDQIEKVHNELIRTVRKHLIHNMHQIKDRNFFIYEANRIEMNNKLKELSKLKKIPIKILLDDYRKYYDDHELSYNELEYLKGLFYNYQDDFNMLEKKLKKLR